MSKKEQPALLKITGIVVLGLALYLSKNLHRNLPYIISKISRFEFDTSIVFNLIFYFRLGIVYYCGWLLFLGKKNSRDVYKKWGTINIILGISVSIYFALLRYMRPYRFYFAFFWKTLVYWIIFVTIYFVIYFLLFKNDEINKYFIDINKKRKLVKRKKVLGSEKENIINVDNGKTEITQNVSSEKFHVSNSENIIAEEIQEREAKKAIRKNGIIRDYYDNGPLKSEKTYLNDILNGRSIEYHPNSRISSIGYYENGEKVGKWKYYDDKGILLSEEVVE
ncbi:toxin-antitoxin system YwqK family antitoxin [Fusobacterium sp. PH5-44]|uniref:toxin-antitoxin system YwqK family antitoxin n=1 Tax=unclassified Fusobacterium TaxID=2648384 RepID=UPI003D1B4A60